MAMAEGDDSIAIPLIRSSLSAFFLSVISVCVPAIRLGMPSPSRPTTRSRSSM
jgi:hypothetical protein